MKTNKLPLVAVTGLGRGENPQPGAAVIASLRRQWPDLEIAGLVYDAMESGIYGPSSPDAAFTLPYPSCHRSVLLSRIDEIREEFPFEILIPTLDAEMEPLLAIRDELEKRGIRTMLPDPRAMASRSKQHLARLAETAGVRVPRTYVVHDAEEAAERTAEMGCTVMIKGPYYEAYRANSPLLARVHARRILAEWGGPIIVQEYLEGDEFDLLAVGDGAGRVLGSCAVRKLVVSAQGKGYAGITVEDQKLTAAAGALMQELKWGGPLEMEFLRTRDGVFHLIEINPRFPAWSDFPAALGCNLGAIALQALLGQQPSPLAPIPPGKIFLRHNVDMVCDSLEFGTLATEGRIIRKPRALA